MTITPRKVASYRCATCGEDWWDSYEGEQAPDTAMHREEKADGTFTSDCPGTGYRVPNEWRR
jgi:DNA-directed RNA polymerase subunit RPC12/RpoP